MTGVPAQAVSLAVSIATQDDGASPVLPMQGLLPYTLPQPAPSQTSFVLRLPLPSDTTLLLGVAAFAQAGGTGCLLGLGSVAHPYQTAILDDEATVALVPYSDDPKTGCQGPARIVSVTPTALAAAGGETLQVIGWGFVPGAQLVLNGQPLQTTYVSAGQLEATTPPSAKLAPVPLQVVLPQGQPLSYQGLRYIAKLLSFSPLTMFDVPDSYHQVAIADLDGDSRPDLLFYPTSYTSDNRVSIAFQHAPLQFTVQPLPLIGDVDGVHPIDLDRDGDIDLVAPSSDGQTLKLLFNDGHAGFTLKTQPLGATETALSCIDLDGDGAPEILFLDAGTGNRQLLYALHNDGSGNFDPQRMTQTRLLQTTSAFTVVGLDYDLDGHVDLLPIDGSEMTVLLNHGTPLPPDDSGASLIQFTNGLSTQMSVEDLDGDQIPDLLAANYSEIPTVFLSRSRPPRMQQELRPACLASVYAAGDLDGDGLPDTAFGCDSSYQIRFQRQLPSHVLTASSQAPPVTYTPNSSDPYLYALQMADLDGDGRRELIFGLTPNTGTGSTNYYVYRNVSQ